jgi:hypothetical protein
VAAAGDGDGLGAGDDEGGLSRPAAVRAITAALRLPADEVATMIDSFENSI